MSETIIRKRMYDLAVSEVLDDLMGDDPEPTQEGRTLIERTTGYQAVEFLGDGDPMFGGKGDDRPLTNDGLFSRHSQIRPGDIAVFKTKAEAQKAGDRAPKRDGGTVGVVPIYDGAPDEEPDLEPEPKPKPETGSIRETIDGLVHRKHLSKDASRVLDVLTQGLGKHQARTIDNAKGAFMAAHIERLGEHRYSVTHYYEQNFDMMRDPDMEFYRHTKGWFPLTFRQDGGIPLNQEVVSSDGRYKPRLLNELISFANEWLVRVKRQQGGLVAIKRVVND